MIRLVCRETGEEYPDTEPVWQSVSGGLLDIDFVPACDPSRITGRPHTLWRYREALPLRESALMVTLDEGWTPLTPVTLDGRHILLKQDHLFPTGSYKDRGAAVMVSKIHDLGITHVIEDSSGNAGCAVAAYCARAGVQCDIYVPASTSPEKLVQLAFYGAHVIRVPGTRDDTARAALVAARSAYYASHTWNPFFLHGTKTFAYEVAEQLGWKSPDVLILPAGNGTLVLGSFIGFRELMNAKIVERLPRIIAVQSLACPPLYEAFMRGSDDVRPVSGAPTIAEGIAIAEPVRGKQILDAIRRSGGDMIAVSEEEIVAATVDVARQGFFIEPTAGATVAGVRRYLKSSPKDETIVSVLTGHGLKAAHTLQHLLS